MTDKTEAQPEALRLADERPYSIDDDLYAWSQSAEQVIRAQHAEIQQLKAQLSARQAAPDGWRLVPVEPTEEMVAAAEEAHMPFGDMQLAIQSALSAAPLPPEREPLSQHDLERLVGNWFAEGWAKKAAFGMLDDYERTRNRSHQ